MEKKSVNMNILNPNPNLTPNPNRPPENGRRLRLGVRQEAFTLIEIMVVVVILGILAATIIPQFVGTTYDAKVSTAKSNIAELESALERFYVNTDRYPTTEEGLKALVEAPAGDAQKWRGPYIKLLRPDPWGNPYQYAYPGTHRASGFDLWSRGADGVDGGTGEGADIGNWLDTTSK
jgi:general secretion pathway protein G